MSQSNRKQSSDNTAIVQVEYLNSRERAARMRALGRLKKDQTSLPIALVDDLLCLDISVGEKVALLDLLTEGDNLTIEHFITSQIPHWQQEIATAAVRHWAEKTDTILWYRLIPQLQLNHLPQRVRFAILDASWRAGGRLYLELFEKMNGLEDHSAALIGLLLQRAIQWNYSCQRFIDLATKITTAIVEDTLPDDKSLVAATGYLLRFAPDKLHDLVHPRLGCGPWLDMVRTAIDHQNSETKRIEKIVKTLEKPLKSRSAEKLASMWPQTWSRHLLDSQTIRDSYLVFYSDPVYGRLDIVRRPSQMLQPYAMWDLFAGCQADQILRALKEISDEGAFLTGSRVFWTLLTTDNQQELVDETKNRLARTADPEKFSSGLHPVCRFRLAATGVVAPAVDHERSLKLFAEERAIIAHPRTTIWNEPFQDLSSADAFKSDGTGRREFFDLAYRQKSANSGGTEPKGFWHMLAAAWKSPGEKIINDLAAEARQQNGIFRLCYINTLSRFKGIDSAALKILDFVRTSEEDEIRGVVQALGGIGTQRAMLELISAITRPNITLPVQMDIAAILSNNDVGQLQSELRSAIKELSPPPNVEDGKFELRETLSALLAPAAEANGRGGHGSQKSGSASVVQSLTHSAENYAQKSISDQDLDHMLGSKIPHYRELSSEVKRALRTAQFFHIQVTGEHAPEHIDLSPVIDMQYKAMELFFREVFEEYCSDLISTGNIQRRLDVIGYARPVPPAMDEFESYIASLPVAKDIPFFSKFKLRKMLRAICQFRPGRRFTLDGLKAFGLFFLVFGRKQCKFGLQNMCHLGFPGDIELTNFTRVLHIFQDFRNRAAHEGFHPDASNDINGIWLNTAEIVQTAFRVRSAINSPPVPQSQPTIVIQKKVS